MRDIIRIGIAVELLILGVIALILRARGWQPRRLGLQFSWGAAAAGVPLFVIYLLLYWMTATIVLLIAPVPAFRLTVHAPFAFIILFVVINSVFEELIVTAGVIASLERKGAAVAITASTLVRCAWHLYQGPLAALSILPVGLLFGALYWQRRNLWPLMVAHAIADVISFALRR